MRGEDRLLELQGIDTSILRREHRHDELEGGEAVRTAKQAADDAEARLGELRMAIDVEQREQRRLEAEIEQLERTQAAEEKRMYDGSIVNQKELEALQHEITGAKQRRGGFEDQVLQRMETIDQLTAGVADAEKQSAEARTRWEQAGEASADELATIATELEAARAQRERLVPEIDPELLDLYEDLRASKKGIGAAALVDGACQGCHQTLSAVQVDRLKKTDGIKRCEHCRRILVIE
ncbi:MAG: C4-type zinc ribbon domain-containing protein [Actinomycetota bacterium]